MMENKSRFYMIMEPDEQSKAISFKGSVENIEFNPIFNNINSAYKFAFKSSLNENDFQVVEVAIGLA